MAYPCPHCNGRLDRVHRNLLERLVCRRVMACARCRRRFREWRIPLDAEAVFLSSRYTCCIQCGNPQVRRLPKRDGIDRMSSHPLSLLMGLAMSPIYHCRLCRLQYRDWRQVTPEGPLAPPPAAAD